MVSALLATANAAKNFILYDDISNEEKLLAESITPLMFTKSTFMSIPRPKSVIKKERFVVILQSFHDYEKSVSIIMNS